jgi:UDP-glucose 4-epimerase
MIIVTGAAGLFGVNFIQYLLKETSEKIIAIDSLFGGNEEYIPKNERVVFMKGDLADKSFQAHLEANIFSTSSISYVFHFAAYAAEGLSPFIRCFNYENNVISTAFIVNMCIQYDIKRLVFTSSMAVYGNSVTPFDESFAPAPVDPYGVAKFASEMDIQIAAEQHGLEFCIIRPHNVYGPYQNIWDPYRNVLGIWMYKSLKGMPITIYGDGTQERAFSYIEDVLPCIWKAATDERAKNQIINVGGIRAYSLNEAATIISDITGNKEITHLEPRHEVKYAYSTHDKSVKLLDFKDTTDLKKGLEIMWEWAKSQPEREQKRWQSYEINKKMYSFWKS